ncbi:hypothetical protein EDC36_1113 [Tepidimonas ignava]|jgi:hypothetical protein|uniref:Uncharacterized protein n=1 Tax=Tepidimonas ignava TaxID=114249 RepID=A0A4R3LF90_9BURK|nr:hypothetical protein [Tepidimonas ignava]TCS97044.1 hypothetical protein EDC36_1113 [Tepidimonas ignava]TSE22278.1 hypothetical protein Tigna_01105 [Tepidimonas ignava]
MTRIQNYLLKFMTELGVASIRNSADTHYILRCNSTTVADRYAFLGWVQRPGEWSILKRRANKTVVQAWRNEHNDLPPGISWREERVVNIKRS